MKKLLFVAALLFCTICIGQTITTEEEYNYLTEGLKAKDKTGADFKRGYYFKESASVNVSGFQVDVNYFYKKETETCQAISIVIKKEKSGKTRYLCLPFNNKKLIEHHINETLKLGITMSMIYDGVFYGFATKNIEENINGK